MERNSIIPPQPVSPSIMPQALPAMVAVALFHFFYAWNDFFLPLIYLAGKPEMRVLILSVYDDPAVIREAIIALVDEGVGRFAPIVEVADDEDLLRVGRPDAEGCPLRV